MSTTTASAVLVPVYRDRAGELHVVLVVRGEHGRHGGQIALPGGIHAPGDADLRETALREAEEEIGLERSAVEVLAKLPEVDTSTGYLVTPFLARLVTEPPAWRRQEREIAEVLNVAVAELARPALRGEETWELAGGPRRVRFVRLGPHKLWGATYRILDPLIPRLLADEWAI
ncbi:MAG TPA: CoA pyrophosphatase [Candidatus Limnocylindria bacterium]